MLAYWYTLTTCSFDRKNNIELEVSTSCVQVPHMVKSIEYINTRIVGKSAQRYTLYFIMTIGYNSNNSVMGMHYAIYCRS